MNYRDAATFVVPINIGDRQYRCLDLPELARLAEVDLDLVPFAQRVLLEMVLRDQGADAAIGFARQISSGEVEHTLAFRPTRLLLQDYTGVPLLVDLAMLREQAKASGLGATSINPRIPTDLVFDHSVQAGVAGIPLALEANENEERRKNGERLAFLRWAAGAFSNLTVVPPGTGIVHQVNLERLVTIFATVAAPWGETLVPETIIGTDSHTTMANGLGVLGWGVGGLEAEAIMLGQAMSVPAPPVIGVLLQGRLRRGVNATDLALSLTDFLRRQGVVGALLEFTGPGVTALDAPARCTIANMAPEYGATAAFFPVDEATVEYLARTGRPRDLIERVVATARRQRLFRDPAAPTPHFHRLLEFDLGAVEVCIAGPSQPHQRMPLSELRSNFERVYHVEGAAPGRGLTDGAIAIAAITSCASTSNPALMLAAGLVAHKAVQKGLTVPPHVKTSLTPGSHATTRYLQDAGLLTSLETLGFHVAAYGCATCNGGSGALRPIVVERQRATPIELATVLSGNRNFERRIHADIRANYLASPPLVVALALAGNIRIDLDKDPLGADRSGAPIFLADIWPTDAEIATLVDRVDSSSGSVTGAEADTSAPVARSESERESCFQWNPSSTYIRRPPYFDTDPRLSAPIVDAHVLLVLGDDVTTDQISPVGEILESSTAGWLLRDSGVLPIDFNSYGARRGNHEVMVRGTFSSRTVRNELDVGLEGGTTIHLSSGARMSVFEASEAYRAEGIPLVILAGRRYGSGSSRDWAAKGPWFLGVRAVFAESFERIHRTNLIAMGILPLELPEGGRRPLGLTGRERFSLGNVVSPRCRVHVRARGDAGEIAFDALSRIDSEAELAIFKSGGMFRSLMHGLAMKASPSPEVQHPTESR